jgi:hypothetical protein
MASGTFFLKNREKESTMLFSKSFSVLLTAHAVVAHATPHASVKRDTSELLQAYDFIVAGGGTAGLTVADRLSEALPESRVHPASRHISAI